MKVLVTGSTGVLGQNVATAARRRRHQVIEASRSSRPPVNIRFPIDLDYDVVIHCATDFWHAKAVEVEPLKHLTGRIVYPSIVAVDQIAFPYYKTKLAAEQVLLARGASAIVRLTQFHEFAHRLAAMAVPAVPLGFRVQSIAAAEAADHLVAVAEGNEEGRLPDVGGPRQVHTLASQVRAVRSVLKKRGPVLELPMPGTNGFRAGHNLHAPAVGTITWERHLAQFAQAQRAA